MISRSDTDRSSTANASSPPLVPDQPQSPEPKAVRRPLRYSNRLSDELQPTTCLQIDEALDQLGRLRFPGEWERTPRTNLLSVYEGAKVTKVHLSRIKGELKITRLDYTLSPASQARREPIGLMFRTVAQELKEAVESGQLEAVTFDRLTGALLPIEHPAVFASQFVTIFFVGALRKKTRGGTTVVRVLFTKKPFNRWIGQVRDGTLLTQSLTDDQARAAKRSPTKSVVVVIRALPGIAEQLLKLKRKVRNDQLKKIVKDGIPHGRANLTRSVFGEYIWQNQALADVITGVGPPEKENKALDDSEVAALSELIQAEFRKEDSGPKATPTAAEAAST